MHVFYTFEPLKKGGPLILIFSKISVLLSLETLSRSINCKACGMSSENLRRELMWNIQLVWKSPPTETFIIYVESSSPSADDYLMGADYPIETYL
jgi:hypothetical protein